jgi:phosphate starvation-inducible PhoH-like protein
MTADLTQRVSAEGVDPLALAGVNDANLIELARRLGVRVSLRGDVLALSGPGEAVERAVPVARALVDLARMGDALDVHDVERLILDATHGAAGGAADGEARIILPGLRRVIQAKTAGQREYLEFICKTRSW